MDEDLMEEMDEKEVLKFLTEHNYLEGAAKGIALQVIDKGKRSLTGNQVGVFEKFIEAKFFNLECSRCHLCPIPTSEVVCALMEDGLCSSCRKMVSNEN